MRMRFGEFLVAEGLVSERDLALALRAQERQRKRRIGEVLVQLGHLDKERLMAAVKLQLESISLMENGAHPMPLGRFLVDEGMVTSAQLEDGLRVQREIRAQPIGEILVGFGVLSREELGWAVRARLDEVSAA